MNKKLFIAAWIIVAYLVSLKFAFAQYLDNENSFFSYKRFYAQLDVLNSMSESKNVRSDIRDFMLKFADGIYAISAGEPAKAKEKLLKAAAIWPEYFGTYFLLARLNEDMGDYGLSARFYKSYLDKLKSFSEGKYRISGPLMRGITPYRIENYDNAYALVRDRLKARGIDLAATKPFETVPNFLRLLIMLVMFGAAYAIMAYRVIPYIRRRRHVNNPPEGSWVCKKCEAYNGNIRKECEKCGEKR